MKSLPLSYRITVGRRVRRASTAVVLAIATAAAMAFSVSNADAQCAPSVGANSGHGSGWVGGAQAGYNWQQGTWVYGVETDISGSGLKTSLDGGLTSLNPCLGNFASTSAKVDWYGTVRGRAGWTVDKFFFYGTGGLAYGHVDLNSTYNADGITLTADTSSVRAGWVAGAGIEYMLRPDLALTLGYQYVDLGTLGMIATSPPAGTNLTINANAHAAFSVVTVGFNWRFPAGPQSPTMPWQGGYVGGHGGGAWGLHTDATYSEVSIPSDARLKRDIALVDRLPDGLGLYRYRYLWSDTVYVGVMAQEVALLHPDAIVHDSLDGYLRVNYARLGLHLMTLPEWRAREASARL
ncbi:MAG TPA: outer membrane beta-barrel protein [Pseudolabrys sp.]|nr:outer membrane beta-barrel protein [Pseudolabrys sp.]